MSRGSTVCYAIISNGATSSASGVLMLAGEEGLLLPCVEEPGPVRWFDVANLNHAVQELVGLRTTTLRCLEGDGNIHQSDVRVYAMEAHAAVGIPPSGARWVTRAGLEDAALTIPAHRALIASWFDEVASAGASGNRNAPWTRLGWLARAQAFVSTELACREFMQTAAIVQLRTWQRSCVLRADTTDGRIFFKASPAMFAHEPNVTQLLAEKYAANFPEVLAIDASERWTLMREVPGRTLLESGDLAQWANALRAFARIQVASVGFVDELHRCGCPEWPHQRLADQMMALLGDTQAMLVGTPHGLDKNEADDLQAFGPALKAIVDRLFDYGLPLALEHGDFRAEHVFFDGDDRFVFFDLSNTAVTHPFFSAVTLLDFEDIPFEGRRAGEARTYLRDAYLEAWTIYEPAERLVAAFELARVVAILYAALWRRNVILPYIEPRKHWEFMIPYWQRKLVRGLRERSEAVK